VVTRNRVCYPCVLWPSGDDYVADLDLATMREDAKGLAGKLCPLCDDVISFDGLQEVAEYCSDSPLYVWPLRMVLCRGCQRVLDDCGLSTTAVGYDAPRVSPSHLTAGEAAPSLPAAESALPPFVTAAAGEIRRMCRDDMRYITLFLGVCTVNSLTGCASRAMFADCVIDDGEDELAAVDKPAE
jgi:hypothetical protein